MKEIISIVVSCYNEEESIQKVILNLKKMGE